MFTLVVKPIEKYEQVYQGAVSIDNFWLKSFPDNYTIEIIIEVLEKNSVSVNVKINGILHTKFSQIIQVFREEIYNTGITYINFIWKHESTPILKSN